MLELHVLIAVLGHVRYYFLALTITQLGSWSKPNTKVNRLLPAPVKNPQPALLSHPWALSSTLQPSVLQTFPRSRDISRSLTPLATYPDPYLQLRMDWNLRQYGGINYITNYVIIVRVTCIWYIALISLLAAMMNCYCAPERSNTSRINTLVFSNGQVAK